VRERKGWLRMKISLEHVAVLKKADIEINGITVTAGLNGTGKTTVGKSIFAMFNASEGLPEKILNARKDSIHAAINLVQDSYGDIENNLRPFQDISFIRRMLSYELMLFWWNEGDSKRREDITEWLSRNIKFEKSENMEKACDEILHILNRPDDDYIFFLLESYYRKVFRDQINHLSKNSTARFEWEIENEQYYTEFSGNELSGYTYTPSIHQKAVYIESQNVLDSYNEREEKSVVSNELFRLLDSRTSFQETMEEYINAKEVKNIVRVIIDEVTHGTLKNEGAGTFTFYDQNMDHSVDISNLSAGLKIFIVIQRLLENGSLRKGDILLIDEPEINLHPEWQVLFAEILVRMQKDLGIYIYINTHSPYFIHAIEVKMAEYETADRGKYYLMEKDAEGLCYSVDVTGNTEKIYELLYKPLEI